MGVLESVHAFAVFGAQELKERGIDPGVIAVMAAERLNLIHARFRIRLADDRDRPESCEDDPNDEFDHDTGFQATSPLFQSHFGIVSNCSLYGLANG
jgi:hypothetical protein